MSGGHPAAWRPLLVVLPLIGAAAIGIIAIQGEPEVLLSRNVHLALLPASILGWWIASRVARALADTPITPVAHAKAGYVALRGTAQAMPDAPPLKSPSGDTCLWYHYHSQSTSHDGSYQSIDTVQPFLLADPSGQCVVLPEHAEVSGGHNHGNVRTITAGDAIYVAGEFRPFSSGTVQQLQALHHALALPLVCDPAGARPFMINAGRSSAGADDWYGLLATANLVVLVASGALLSYVLWLAR